MNFIGAGAPQRRAAQDVLAQARAGMDEARRSSDAATEETRALLADLDTQRRQVAERLSHLQPLYELARLRDPGASAANDAARQPGLSFDAAALPSVPSAAAWLAVGALAGAGIGAGVAFAAGTAAAAWAGAAAVCGLAGLLTGGALQGNKTATVAGRHAALAQQWQERAAQHVAALERIRHGAVLSMRLTAALERRLLAQETQLESIAMDTTNAAVLLKDVLNTALLNEEGAFLDGVIGQLHGQQQRIAGFAGHLAAA
nr:hypothetical protein [uncultured Massilia sp.]